MQTDLFNELPIRSKTQMMSDIVQIIRLLHEGKRSASEHLIEDLKTRGTFLDENIQQDILMFISQVQFQQVYDPWHKVTPEVTAAADRLIQALGFYR